MSWGANKGEWSELYAFLKLLLEGFAHEADMNLGKKPARYEFVALLRNDSGEMRTIQTRKSQYGASPGISSQKISEFTKELFESIRGGVGSFELPGAEEIMKSLGLTKIKASSGVKTDLLGKIKSPTTGEEIARGFSIKSQLGSPSTLINASSHTRFLYCLDLSKIQIEEQFREFESLPIRDKVRLLDKHGVLFESKGALSPALKENLSFWGDEFEVLLGKLMLSSYLEGTKKISELCRGPFFGSEPFKYKMKSFLEATALGMVPSKPWDGNHPVHGGYIVVGKDGELLILDANAGDAFRDYLFANSSFETPSSSRHEVGTLNSTVGGSSMTLTLQVRFKA